MAGLTEQDKQALQGFKQAIFQAFPEQIESIQLFGSKARGDAEKHSDVDVLVILKEATMREQHEASKISAKIMLETGVLISPKVFSPELLGEIQKRNSMFWQTIQTDLVPV